MSFSGLLLQLQIEFNFVLFLAFLVGLPTNVMLQFSTQAFIYTSVVVSGLAWAPND